MIESMSDGVGETSESSRGESTLERAVEQAADQIESQGDSNQEIARLQVALRGLVSSAEHWQCVGDAFPDIRQLRDFGMSVLLQVVEDLPQYRRFQEWVPPNWRDKPELDLDMALKVINEGIPLIWVPAAGTVSTLLRARNSEMRARILVDRCAGISRNCLTILGEVRDPELTVLAEAATEAAQTLAEGHFRSAQALASNILDTWMRDAVRRGVFNLTGLVTYKTAVLQTAPFTAVISTFRFCRSRLGTYPALSLC